MRKKMNLISCPRFRVAILLVVLSMVMDAYCVVWSGNPLQVFEVKHKFSGTRGRIGKSLHAIKTHDAHRHRRMLSFAVDLPLGGNGHLTGVSLYFTKLAIGTPPKDYHVQVDTGSDILWVNCAGCDRDGECPKKSDVLGINNLQFYDPKASSSGKVVTCDQVFCTAAVSGGSGGGPSCKAGGPCNYVVTYGDGSSTSGVFVRDNVQLNRISENMQTMAINGSIAFGCGAKQSGQLGSSDDEALDGILGFGQASSSMVSQLASSGKVRRMFSHCLDGTNGGGIFAIGKIVQPNLKESTPLIPHEAHYNVIMKAIEVSGYFLQLPTDEFDTGARSGTIVDSGTTLAYLPDEVFNALMEKILAHQPTTHTVHNQFICVNYDGNIDDAFPVVTFHFEGSLHLEVHPHEYMFEVEDDEWCIGWQNSGLHKDGNQITLLGDMVLSNKLVMYDLENQTIGWMEYNCSSSIKVMDDWSGNAFSVGAHNLVSPGCSIRSGKVVSLVLLFIVALLNFI